jgi:hypothetical protein
VSASLAFMPAPQSNASAAAAALTNTVMAGSRSRPQARKKVNDDAAYFGPPTGAGVKRHAADKADGEPRVKRKKVDATAGGVGRKAADKTAILEGGDVNVSLVSVYIPALESIPRWTTYVVARLRNASKCHSNSIVHRLNSRACPLPRFTDTSHSST